MVNIALMLFMLGLFGLVLIVLERAFTWLNKPKKEDI